MKKSLLGVSLFTVVGLYALLSVVIILVFMIFDLPVLWAILLSIAILLIQFIIGPWLTDLSMKWFYKVDFKHEVPQYLDEFIKQVCQDKNMKYPKIGFINDSAPNAFTYGRTKNDARIVLTRGIYELLDEDEVKAVVAHELGHACHYDMMLMTFVQIVPLILYAVYEICLNPSGMFSKKSSSSSSSSSSDDSNYAEIVGAIAFVLYIISQYIILWLSRTREYYADTFSIKTTKNPNALASALVKIGFGLSTKDTVSGDTLSTKATAALGIAETKGSKALAIGAYDKDGNVSKESIKRAMQWDLFNTWAKFYEIHSTHPLISKRVLAISKISKRYDQEPFIVFDLKKPKSYAPKFFKELLIMILPTLLLIATIITGIVVIEHMLTIFGVGGVIAMLASLFKHRYSHKTKAFKPSTVESLVGNIDVSNIKTIPCTISGKIIGRGNPGCIFNEDFVIQDDTGIMLLNYSQPLITINKFFALFKSKKYFDKYVKVRGWYKRAPVPFIEVLTIEIDGKIKKCHTVRTGYILRFIALGVFTALAILAPFL
ncbi:MAG: M48 family metalloprotease [Clostridia bacterium]|nr:M48 family metalloprotease [Clostridia bacterium]